MTIAILVVLVISLYTGLENTRELLIGNATNQMAAMQRSLAHTLDPLENRAQDVAQQIYEGKIDPADEEGLRKVLFASMAGDKNIKAMGFLYPDFRVNMVDRKTGRLLRSSHDRDPVSERVMRDMDVSPVGSWGPLVYVPEAGETVMNYRQPVLKDNHFIGVVIIAIPVAAVSQAVKLNGLDPDQRRFVLYGDDHVLFHQGYTIASERITLDGVAPKLTQIGDPVLSSIWSAPRTPFRMIKGDRNFDGHFTEVGGEKFQFIYTTLEGYTDKPLIIGYQLPFEDATRQLSRLASAGLVGLLILVISIFLAFFIGRKISQPIRALADASQQISRLDFKSVEPLKRSRLKELDDAATAYNTMLRGLGWFENYVPKSLVKKLMISGDAHSETRNVTVMFTDIVGFTPQAENMPSEEVANLLNEHFEILARAIEKEGGTIDKYIGDAVMAFWGAPDHQIDHPARACRAAISIAQGIRENNEIRQSAGKSPIHMRIGIHTGQLVVGNIGSTGRLNYTVVGDTVNVAQRIEQLGKSLNISAHTDILTLVSDNVHDEVKDMFKLTHSGEFAVKGRDSKISIYQLN
ncbi:adenylate/guanylate cyclase domain-containing protein [Sneathiella glossodoripedis]|uniref:adenylate/guanylate cyclase domain-containing protein n=1 Tax=Sneathiella glossodoripedis TaxID=418853 RepID=UPI000472F1E5|nr:adenylate/guanylate cyclase domain-containing protein [Sneathiella glossodoripedis]